MMLICEQCHFTFKSDKKARKYCRLSCAQKARRHRVTIRCRGCGRFFEVKWSERARRKFCGRSCRGALERKSKRPTKEQLQHLIERLKYPEIGEMYGVAASTVGNWVLAYGLRSPHVKLMEDGRRGTTKPTRRSWGMGRLESSKS
jgi:hypothetical protein